MYVRSHLHPYTKEVNIPEDYSGNAFADINETTYEAKEIPEEVAAEVEVEQEIIAEKIAPPHAPASKSMLSKIFPKGMNGLFCNDNILLIGIIAFLFLSSNEIDTEILIILLLLLIL